MSQLKRLGGLALAGILGVGLAVALFPSAPEVPQTAPAPASKKPASGDRAASSARAEPPRREGASEAQRPGPRGDGAAAGLPREPADPDAADRGVPPPPPGRAGDPISRHLLVDADGWVRLAEKLAEAGMKPEAQEAGQLARAMRDASNKPRDQLDDLFIQERELLVDLQQSPAADKIQDDLVGLEMGLTAAQQGGVHPVDMKRKNQGASPAPGKEPDTGAN